MSWGALAADEIVGAAQMEGVVPGDRGRDIHPAT